MSPILELSNLAGKHYRAMSVAAGLDPFSKIHFSVASGIDIALSFFELGTGVRFQGMSPEAASKVVTYFEEEATRMEAVDHCLALGYRAWAAALLELYVPESPALLPRA
jgi:hypothetical protein